MISHDTTFAGRDGIPLAFVVALGHLFEEEIAFQHISLIRIM